MVWCCFRCGQNPRQGDWQHWDDAGTVGDWTFWTPFAYLDGNGNLAVVTCRPCYVRYSQFVIAAFPLRDYLDQRSIAALQAVSERCRQRPPLPEVSLREP